MKKNHLLLALAAGSVVFGAASCASDDEPMPTPGDGATVFQVRLPAEMESRAFGDGQSAKQLYYAIYETGTSTPLPIVETADATNPALGVAEFPAGSLQTTVTLNLPRGKQYDIIWFAKNANAPYTLDIDAQNFTVDYESITTASEDNDAFVKTIKAFAISGPESQTVELKRPFAQLNMGTSDLQIALNGMLDVSTTTVAVNDVYTQFNFMTGDNGDVAPASKTNVTLTAQRPQNEKFPYPADVETSPYEYLSMEYLLVPAQKEITDVTFSIADEAYAAATFSNVPLQRNHRTNIFGALLTSPADFNVVINPIFDDPDFDYDIKDYHGEVAPELPAPDADGIINLSHPAELARLQKDVAEGNDFAGQQFVLAADIDLNNAEWTPIGDSSKPFRGSIDGQLHKIKNLSITKPHNYSGLFGNTTTGGKGAEIKNLVIENATVINTSPGANIGTGVVAGSPYTTRYTNITIQGVIKVEGFRYAGGAFGHSAYANLTNITVDAAPGSYVKTTCTQDGFLSTPNHVGGILGYAGEGSQVFDGLISNIDVIGTAYGVGGLVGTLQSGNTIKNSSCTGNATMINASADRYAQAIGGIFGIYVGNVTMQNCTFSGTLTASVKGEPFTNFLNNKMFGMYYGSKSTGVSDKPEYVTILN